MRIVETSDAHEDGWWCWCRPSVTNTGTEMVVQHRNLSSEFLASRKLAGGPDFESDGQAADWREVFP